MHEKGFHWHFQMCSFSYPSKFSKNHGFCKRLVNITQLTDELFKQNWTRKNRQRFNHHVYVKRQTRICRTWLRFLFTCRLLFNIFAPKLVVSRNFLFIRIVLSCFYLLIFYFEKSSVNLLPYTLIQYARKPCEIHYSRVNVIIENLRNSNEWRKLSSRIFLATFPLKKRVNRRSPK